MLSKSIDVLNTLLFFTFLSFQFHEYNEMVIELENAPNFNFGDYYLGSNMDELIEQLSENDTNYEISPASKSAIEALPNIKITEQDSSSYYSLQCAVCQEDKFEVNEEVKQMPCEHIFHANCIIPWLELHNSCPLCRYQLPTQQK